MNPTLTRILSAIHSMPDRPHHSEPGYEHWLAEQVFIMATKPETLEGTQRENVDPIQWAATIDELESLWNAQADSYNQWIELGLDEIVSFAQKIERERCAAVSGPKCAEAILEAAGMACCQSDGG